MRVAGLEAALVPVTAAEVAAEVEVAVEVEVAAVLEVVSAVALAAGHPERRAEESSSAPVAPRMDQVCLQEGHNFAERTWSGVVGRTAETGAGAGAEECQRGKR